MTIASTDLHFRLSGGAANASAAASLGGAKSSNDAGAGLLADISAADAAAGEVDYRCVYVHNAHATLTLVGAQLAIAANTPSTSTDIAIGVGASAVNGTEQSVADLHTAPAGVTFGTSAALGDIPAGQSRAVWVRRTVTAGAVAVASDTATLRVSGSSTDGASAGDTTPPTASSAAVANSTPTVVAVTMSEAMDPAYAAAGAWTVSGHTVTSVAIGGSSNTVVSLTLSAGLAYGETARVVNYTQPGSGGARDVAGNLLATLQNLYITNNVAAPGDTTPPAFSSAQVANSTPSIIVLTFNENLANVAPAASAFTVSGGRTVTAVGAPSGATIALTVNTAYANGDTITVAYTKPGSGNALQDNAGNQVATFAAQSVTNNVQPQNNTYDALISLSNVTASSDTPPIYTSNDGRNDYNYYSGGMFPKHFADGANGSVSLTPTADAKFLFELFSSASPTGANDASFLYGIEPTYGSSYNYYSNPNGGGVGTVANGDNSKFTVNAPITLTRSGATPGGGNTATLIASAVIGGVKHTLATVTNFPCGPMYARWTCAYGAACTKVQSTGLTA